MWWLHRQTTCVRNITPDSTDHCSRPRSLTLDSSGIHRHSRFFYFTPFSALYFERALKCCIHILGTFFKKFFGLFLFVLLS